MLLASAAYAEVHVLSVAPDARTADEVLKASAEAIAALKALSYEAHASSEGPLAAGTPVHDGLVTAVRAEVGGWKLAVSGKAATTAKDVTESAKLDLGYDGDVAWSLKEKEKIAFTETIKKDSDVEVFFRRNSAGPVVAWEVLGPKPMVLGGTATLDGTGKAGGEDCVIVKVTGLSGGEDQFTSARVFVAVKDNLPRRIERSREIKDTDGSVKTVTRALELSKVAIDGRVSAVPFTLSAPDGYTIRTTPSSRRDAKKTEAAGDNVLKGPGVKDKEAAKPRGDAMMASGKGQRFPEFTLKDPEGNEFTLDSYKGEIVVLDFWATWCGPCKAIMPELQKLHNKYKDRGVRVIGVNLYEENPDAAVKYKKDKGYTYGMLLRADDLGQKLQINSIPTVIVLDAQGNIVVRKVGGGGLVGVLTEAIDAELEKAKK